MTFTVSFLDLSLLIIAIAFLILVIFAVPTLLQLRKTAKSLQEFSEEGKIFLGDAKEITSKINEHLGSMDEALTRVKDVSMKATSLVEVVVDALKPMVTYAGILAAIVFGIKQFKKGGGEDVGE